MVAGRGPQPGGVQARLHDARAHARPVPVVPGTRFSSTNGRVDWDYSGLWVLADDGRVKRAPDVTVEPPGFYPSPNRPRQYELWTGTTWAAQYRGRGPQCRAAR